MVAPSFQKMEIITEVYTISGRNYVKVRNSKTGATRQVRWYSEDEYNKYYPPVTIVRPAKSQREVLGFGNAGYVTIFKGNTYEDREWFKLSEARYTRWWGWYFGSDMAIPEDLPTDVEPVRLNWDNIGDVDGRLNNEDAVKAYVDSLLYEPGRSQFQGEIGERIERTVTIERAYALDNGYGSIMYTMVDNEENIYLWTTTAKKWEEGSVHHIKGTIKALKTYKGQRESVLTRCTEVK